MCEGFSEMQFNFSFLWCVHDKTYCQPMLVLCLLPLPSAQQLQPTWPFQASGSHLEAAWTLTSEQGEGPSAPESRTDGCFQNHDTLNFYCGGNFKSLSANSEAVKLLSIKQLTAVHRYWHEQCSVLSFLILVFTPDA